MFPSFSLTRQCTLLEDRGCSAASPCVCFLREVACSKGTDKNAGFNNPKLRLSIHVIIHGKRGDSSGEGGVVDER